MATLGGPAIPVSVQTGGQVQGGAAIPVAVVTDGRAQQGGPAQPVQVVTSGPVQGGPALPVVAAAAGATVAAGPAIKVYVVSGVLGAIAPVNLTVPAISGTANVGQTLTATTGTWLNSPTSYTYQWNRNGAAIGGATASTYVLTASDPGTTITVMVTATNAAGSASATSAGSVIFTPTSVSGIKGWWKASSIAQADSSAVATWTDSVSGIAVTQGTAGSRPTYRTTQGPSSTPAVSFDGGDNLNNTTVTGSSLFSNNQCHIFIVMKQTGADPQNTVLSWWTGAGDVIEALLSYDDVLYWDFGNSTPGSGRVSVAQPGGWDDTWHLVQLIRESPDSGTSRIRVDGSQLTSGAVTKTITNTDIKTLVFGAQSSGGSIPLTGFITDILIYNVALGTTDRQNIETYFNGLYILF